MPKVIIDLNGLIPLTINSPKADWEAAVSLLNTDALMLSFAERHIQHVTGKIDAKVKRVKKVKNGC